MLLNICVNDMALFGPYAAVVEGKTFFDSDGSKEGLPTRRDSGPTKYKRSPLWQTWFCWRFLVFSYTLWCAIVAGEICSESCDCLGSATMAGTVRDLVFQACDILSWVGKLDDQILVHFLVKGVVKESRCHRGRNFKWCVVDGGRGVCSSDVHHLVEKSASAARTQFTHATRSPRARQIAGRVVRGS